MATVALNGYDADTEAAIVALFGPFVPASSMDVEADAFGQWWMRTRSCWRAARPTHH